jgi:hypothetical protein
MEGAAQSSLATTTHSYPISRLAINNDVRIGYSRLCARRDHTLALPDTIRQSAYFSPAAYAQPSFEARSRSAFFTSPRRAARHIFSWRPNHRGDLRGARWLIRSRRCSLAAGGRRMRHCSSSLALSTSILFSPSSSQDRVDRADKRRRGGSWGVVERGGEAGRRSKAGEHARSHHGEREEWIAYESRQRSTAKWR